MDPAVAAALDEVLTRGQRPRMRALAKLSDLRPRQLAGFVETWLQAPVERRRSVAAALVELSEENFELTFDEVLKLLLDDPDAEVRRSAIEGLWESDEIAVAERLLRMLASDEDDAVRAQAASGLGHFAYLAELEELDRAVAERIRGALLATATDHSAPSEVRRRAIEAVSFISGDKAIQQLIADAYAQSEPKMRASALFAMGRNCDLRWSPSVLEALGSDDPELRFEAARAAGEIEDRRAVPALLRLLDDRDHEVRLEAIVALGNIGGEQARAALQHLVKHRDQRIAEAAADALVEAQLGENIFNL